jgi:hypothetical protein
LSLEFDSTEAQLPLLTPNQGKDNLILINVEPRTHELIVQGGDVLSRGANINPFIHSGIDRITRFLASPIVSDSSTLPSLPKQREKKPHRLPLIQ